MTLAARAGLLSCAFCFAAGAIRGPIRVSALEPSLGRTAAVAIEPPIMLAVMVLAARALLHRNRRADPLAIGPIGLALLLAAETILAALLARPSPFAPPREGAGWIGLALKLAFAATPKLVAAVTGGVGMGRAGEPAGSPEAPQR
ncbi:MAG: hypothetical protein RML45_13025 [Acetobacteraceae bacterium]|nr:hypothetical protein [Acetobacteraceae bacterium]